MSHKSKAISQLLVLLLVLSGPKVVADDAAKVADQSKEVIRPLVAERFGQVITVEGTFVKKRNTYHDQNMVEEKYLLNVLSVDGKKLQMPVTIEYRAGNEQVENGVKYRMRAYETLYTEGTPAGWQAEPAQVNYGLVHQLIIKDLSKNP